MRQPIGPLESSPSEQALLEPFHGVLSARDSLLTFQDVTAHYRLSRRQLPPARPVSSNAEERLWRLVQTHTLPCRHRLHRIRVLQCLKDSDRIYPSIYPPTALPVEQSKRSNISSRIIPTTPIRPYQTVGTGLRRWAAPPGPNAP